MKIMPKTKPLISEGLWTLIVLSTIGIALGGGAIISFLKQILVLTIILIILLILLGVGFLVWYWKRGRESFTA